MLTRSKALIMTAAVMTLTAGAPAVANAGPTPIPCFSSDPHNGTQWTADISGGYATFYEYGDRLQVVDEWSDGVRTKVHFQYCDGYGYHTPSGSPFDSGPNEGFRDTEWYDFDYAEGRLVRFKVCTNGCNGWVYANA